MKKYEARVTYARVKLAVMTNCRAGGQRFKVMEKFVIANAKAPSKSVEKDALNIVEKALTNRNAWRVLRWLRAVSQGENRRAPNCFSNQI